MTKSTLPAMYPELAPKVMPIKPETNTTAKAMRRETRAPYIKRLRMSRPRLSVPRIFAEPMPCGGFIIAVSSCLLGSCGAKAGPKIPTAMKVSTINPPVKALTWSHGSKRAARSWLLSVADSRVNDCIKSVNNQIDRDEGHGVCHDEPGDQRIISRVERGNQQASAARPGEYGFDDDRTAEQR